MSPTNIEKSQVSVKNNNDDLTQRSFVSKDSLCVQLLHIFHLV